MSLRSFCVIRVIPVLATLFVGAAGAVALPGCTPKIGNSCSLSTDCSQLGDRLCDTNQPSGYCTVFNCEPDQCPNAICVAFGPTLDPACGSIGSGRGPRFEVSFCLAPCSSNSDCRDQYECVDLSNPANQIKHSAQVVDLGAADGGLGFGVCMAATCGDGIQDGSETDVDCGGSVCHMCNDREHCNSGSDCYSGICAGGSCVEQSCSDGALDGMETDVDCGGPACAPCPSGKTCQGDTDCSNGFCNGAECAPGTCTDMMQSPPETGIDCGGPICPPCATGLPCATFTDCTSRYCGSGTCVTGPCTTDSDCLTGETCFEGSFCTGPSLPSSCLGDGDCGGAGVTCFSRRCAIPPICYVPDAGAPWTPYLPDGGAFGGGGATTDGGAGGAPSDGGVGGMGGAPSDGGMGGMGGAPSDGGAVGDAGDAG